MFSLKITYYYSEPQLLSMSGISQNYGIILTVLIDLLSISCKETFQF